MSAAAHLNRSGIRRRRRACRLGAGDRGDGCSGQESRGLAAQGLASHGPDSRGLASQVPPSCGPGTQDCCGSGSSQPPGWAGTTQVSSGSSCCQVVSSLDAPEEPEEIQRLR